MNLRIWVTVATCISLTASAAFAADAPQGWYVMPSYHQTGVDNANSKYRNPAGQQVEFDAKFGDDTHPSYTVGYAFAAPYRLDVTYMSRSNDIKANAVVVNETLDVDTIVLSGWRDFALGERWALYAGIGVGHARLKAGGLDGSVYLTELGGGALWRAWRNFTIDVGYRYQIASNAELTGDGAKLTTDYSSQSALIGIRYTFARR